MALLSHVTVIVRTGEGSGCLAQAGEAIRHGRPLYLMRSLAENVTLKFPGELLQSGAQILSDETIEVLFQQLPSLGRSTP